jgi:hypothetical protein
VVDSLRWFGNPQSLQVTIPPASGTGKGTPTGIVYNGSAEFKIDNWTSLFLFATIDGTISGWSHFDPSTALIGVTHKGAVLYRAGDYQQDNREFSVRWRRCQQ